MNCRKCKFLEEQYRGTLDPVYYCTKYEKEVNDFDLIYNFMCTEEIRNES